MRTRQLTQGAVWIGAYLLLTLAPLFVLLAEPRPPGREWWRELSVALGFTGMVMMALQFALTARFQVIKSPYGSDVVYHFHRQISLIATAMILIHPIMLFVGDPRLLSLLNFLEAPWRARAAVTATVALIALIVISVWRVQLKIDYTKWRIWHSLLATAAVFFGMAHILLVGHYLNAPWKVAFWSLYIGFWTALLLWIRFVKPAILMTRPYQVDEVIQERGGSWTLALRPSGHAGLRFQPGQFAWITAWGTPFGDTEHPFSFSGSAARPDRLTFTIKELGDFTRRIKELKQGELVYVDGPFGSLSCDRHPSAKGFLFIAGGIGITPMMSMLRTLADRGDRRPVVLMYASRDWESVTFREELEELKGRLNLTLVHVLQSPPEGWTGERGFMTAEMIDKYLPDGLAQDEWETFICGPPPMMDAVEKHLVKIGVPLGDFHAERFNLV